MAYNYNEAETSDDADWEGDGGMGNERYGIYSDIGPTPTDGGESIDPSLIMQTSPSSMYPPVVTNYDNYDNYDEQNAMGSDAQAPTNGGRYKFPELDPPSVENYPKERNGDYLCNRYTPKGELCGKAIREKHRLKKHLRGHDKPVYCPYYGEGPGNCIKGRGAEQKDVRRHVIAAHPDWAKQYGIKEEDEVFACSCEKEFTREDNLKRHQKKHGHN
ncbi:hypothetical protein PG996_008801 [Apiospora saccharicola]|uniref:C2H2-type domain-containing protein n=1 Tax=Apiospora saccharicola TaxID=335842 RepID=A0ABR1UYY5_9PEZI